jgi:hypothetical protein
VSGCKEAARRGISREQYVRWLEEKADKHKKRKRRAPKKRS